MLNTASALPSNTLLPLQYNTSAITDTIRAHARRMYGEWTEKQGIHSNRYPAFVEISHEAQDDWFDKAAEKLNFKVTRPVQVQTQVHIPAKTAWPTNDEVFAELVRRKTPGTVMYISTNAVNDVMQAVKHLSCADMQKDTYIAGMQAVVDGLIKERDEAVAKLAEVESDDIQAICESYESGYGHGLKNDGLDLSKTPHFNPIQGQAYQYGYEAGLSRRVNESTQPVKEELDMLDWELGCDVSVKGTMERRIVTIGQLVELMKKEKNLVIHHCEPKTGVKEEDLEVEINLPQGWRLVHEGTAGLRSAISAAVVDSLNETEKGALISVRKFLERLDYTHGPVKIKLKKDANGTLELAHGTEGKTKYAVRCN